MRNAATASLPGSRFVRPSWTHGSRRNMPAAVRRGAAATPEETWGTSMTHRAADREPVLRSTITVLALAGWTAACGAPGNDAAGDDYLSPDLRAAVEQLKADVAANPTDETTIAERARILDEWVDAYALGGGEVGLEGPRVRLQATLPQIGRAHV